MKNFYYEVLQSLGVIILLSTSSGLGFASIFLAACFAFQYSSMFYEIQISASQLISEKGIPLMLWPSVYDIWFDFEVILFLRFECLLLLFLLFELLNFVQKEIVLSRANQNRCAQMRAKMKKNGISVRWQGQSQNLIKLAQASEELLEMTIKLSFSLYKISKSLKTQTYFRAILQSSRLEQSKHKQMNDQSKSNITLKYLVVGDSGVGKTSLLMRYCEDSFQTDYLSTIGVDFKIKRIEHNGKPITLNIWDTAGQERFRNITKSFYKGAHGIILVYSITDPNSYTHIENWVDQIREAGSAETDMILIGSKSDLYKQRKVSVKQGESLAQKYNMQFVETSAKQDSNIASVFQKITDQVVTRLGDQLFLKNKNVALDKEKKKEKSKSQCC